jgi:hypothetical protein
MGCFVNKKEIDAKVLQLEKKTRTYVLCKR